MFAQVGYSVDELVRWRSTIDYDRPVYAGVMVVPSVPMARKISADIPQLAVPDSWVHAIERDPAMGVELACDLVAAIRASGAFEGVHLIPVSRYREVAARLEVMLASGLRTTRAPSTWRLRVSGPAIEKGSRSRR
jgi:5,10-methylenetetrahydrofolate reductase